MIQLFWQKLPDLRRSRQDASTLQLQNRLIDFHVAFVSPIYPELGRYIYKVIFSVLEKYNT